MQIVKLVLAWDRLRILVLSHSLTAFSHGETHEKTQDIQAYHANLIKWAMRDLGRFVRPLASKAALEMAASMGVGDIRDVIWNEQISKTKDPDRAIFHWEHVYPVSDLAKRCLSLAKPDLGQIEASISQAQIAWILKSENRQLKSHNRGDNPFRYYRDAGIDLEGR